MNYKEYLELLNKKNIKLFDYEKRISYYNITNYNITNYNINNNQTGGGNNIFNTKNQNNLRNIINISLSSNPQLLLGIIN
jgi:hypothetical protein